MFSFRGAITWVTALILLAFGAPLLFPEDGIQPMTDHPLIVGPESRIAVMEYEAWFGPRAVNLPSNGIRPLLHSMDMDSAGGGYDSADPDVIRQHVSWMEQMGIDAALVDLSNNVSCTFNSEWFVTQYLENSNSCPVLRSAYQVIRNNTGNLYPALTMLRTPLKLIPLLGGIDQDVLYKDLDGKTAFEKEIEYFGKWMRRYPSRSIIYEGKPLMVIYLGAAQDSVAADNPLWFQIRQFLKEHPEITDKYTFRMMAGYLDSQPSLWTKDSTPDEPVQIAAQYHFWSWVDRLKPSCSDALCPYYPSYNRVGARVENFTAAIASAGQNGWGCPSPDYCEDASLRFGAEKNYATFEKYMIYARQLDPIFLFLHQFNEFTQPDEGFNADSNDDIEPANVWGESALRVVGREIWAYHHPVHDGVWTKQD
jgi:hypothetical protein